MVDRVYRSGIPALRKELEALRGEFSTLHLKTDWVRLRIVPLLKHARELERLVSSQRFSREYSRLSRGVAQFHSDLVYLRTNSKELRKILQIEQAKHSN